MADDGHGIHGYLCGLYGLIGIQAALDAPNLDVGKPSISPFLIAWSV